MRIEEYSDITLLPKAPFRGTFRETFRDLPGSFRDPVFLRPVCFSRREAPRSSGKSREAPVQLLVRKWSILLPKRLARAWTQSATGLAETVCVRFG